MVLECVNQQNGEPGSPVAFDSEAWLLVGMTSSLAGWLALSDGFLAFADEDGDIHFSLPLEDIEQIWSPWYYFGGGLKMRIEGHTFRITFTLPNDQPGGDRRPIHDGSNLTKGASAATFALSKFRDITRGRELTRTWKRLLGV